MFIEFVKTEDSLMSEDVAMRRILVPLSKIVSVMPYDDESTSVVTEENTFEVEGAYGEIRRSIEVAVQNNFAVQYAHPDLGLQGK